MKEKSEKNIKIKLTAGDEFTLLSILSQKLTLDKAYFEITQLKNLPELLRPIITKEKGKIYINPDHISHIWEE